jgi:hypothetical protein
MYQIVVQSLQCRRYILKQCSTAGRERNRMNKFDSQHLGSNKEDNYSSIESMYFRFGIEEIDLNYTEYNLGYYQSIGGSFGHIFHKYLNCCKKKHNSRKDMKLSNCHYKNCKIVKYKKGIWIAIHREDKVLSKVCIVLQHWDNNS